MATVKEHYENLLSDVYVWMSGGFDDSIRKYTDLFKAIGIVPNQSGIAIDLGAGCGFQTIPLAKAGFRVTAVDLDGKLLGELKRRSGSLSIKTVQDDLVNFDRYAADNIELIVCMTDTICHLESKQKVISLFEKVAASLDECGRFILSFRDLSSELSGLDRFLPVRRDDSTVLLCFLEYEAETVNVHDLLYRKQKAGWRFQKSYYKKLRLSQKWVEEQLSAVGFARIESTLDRGFVFITAVR